MKSLIRPLAGLAVLAATAGAAMAAPPEYCALYAREYANQFAAAAGEKLGSEPKIQDEAYYRCLNMDEEPAMPATSAYSDLPVGTADQGGPLEPVPGATAADTTAQAKHNAAPILETAKPSAGPLPPTPVQQTADSTPSTRSYTGGKKPGTPEWLAACRKYFPHSFNEKDGTILPHGSNQRVLCK
jgi:hypothetical protein